VYSRSSEEFFGFLSQERDRKLDHDLAVSLLAASSRWRAMSTDLADSPLFSSLASLGAKLYASNRILLDTDALVIFVCGSASPGRPSAREQLLRYAKKYFKHGTLFRAEDAFPVLSGSGSDDLLTIEHSLAEYSDCVLIINESAGTLAELGAFASNEAVVQKLFVINPQEHLGVSSFINLGPIAKVDRKSRFKGTLHVDLHSVSLYFDTILERIEKNAVRKRRLGVDFSKVDAWKSTEGKLRFLLLQDILNLFCPITDKELLKIMKSLFPKEWVNFTVELGLLVATNKITKEDDTYLSAPSCSKHTYDVDSREWLGIRKRVLALYRTKDKIRITRLQKRSSESL